MIELPVRELLLLHLAVTLFMVGVIWFVQVVHYPLLSRIGRSEVPSYEQAHARRARWVVGPPMLIELAGGLLLLGARPASVPLAGAVSGVVLLAVIGFSTVFVQIPCHEKLSETFQPSVHRRLVRTNWVRTGAWSLRGLLVLWMVGTC